MHRGRTRRAWVVGTAVPFAVLTLFVPVGSAHLRSTYAAVSVLSYGAFLFAGVGLVIAAVVVSGNPTTGSLGPLAAGAGVTWLAAAWVGWEAGPPLLRSAAMVLACFLAPVLLHLALTAPSGRLADSARIVAAAAGYAVTAMTAVGVAITRDPFLDPNCWDNCTDNVFAVMTDPAVARVLEIVWHATVVIGGIGAAAVACATLVKATPVARSVGWPLLSSVCLANLAEAIRAAALLLDPAENPTRTAFLAMFYLRALSLAFVTAGLSLDPQIGWPGDGV